jgi:hypothetical protein
MKKIICCLCMAACLGTMACAGPLFKNYGRITFSQEVTTSLESYTLQSQYRYYVSGSDAYPNALMGLHRDYRLDPETLWKEVDMTPKKMKETIESIKTRASEYWQFPQGYHLLDDKGRPIGLWYSIPTAPTLVRMQENGTVRIDTPDLETYIKLEPIIDPEL